MKLEGRFVIQKRNNRELKLRKIQCITEKKSILKILCKHGKENWCLLER